MISRLFHPGIGKHIRESMVLPEAIRHQQATGGQIYLLTVNPRNSPCWAGMQYVQITPKQMQTTLFFACDLVIAEEMSDAYHRLYRPVMQGLPCEVWLMDGPSIPWSHLHFHNFYNPFGQVNTCAEYQYYQV